MKRRTGWTCLLFSLLALPAGDLRGQDGPRGEASPEVVRFGYPLRLFAAIDPADVQVAFPVRIHETTRAMGSSLSLKIVFFDTPDSVVAALKEGGVEMATIPTMNYLRNTTDFPVEPFMNAMSGEGVGDSFVLLARRDRGTPSLSRLKGARLLLEAGYSFDPVVRMWLDVLLMREGLEAPESLFGQISERARSSQAVLPVFFGQADACLAPSDAFRTMAELNPQIEKDLVPLAVSPRFCHAMTFIRKDCPERLRRLLRENAHIQDYARGRMVFDLFRMDRAVPYRSEYLQTIFDLLREHANLKARRPGRHQ